MNDLEEAIRVSRQAVAATPDDHPDLPILLYNLGNKLQSQYEKTGRMDELDEAIRLSRQPPRALVGDHRSSVSLLLPVVCPWFK